MTLRQRFQRWMERPLRFTQASVTWNSAWRTVFTRPVPSFADHWHMWLVRVGNMSGIENTWLRVLRKDEGGSGCVYQTFPTRPLWPRQSPATSTLTG